MAARVKGPPARVPGKWVRGPADEQAAANGCRFDASRGEHVLDFARRHLRLYEGDFAGRPLEPMGWQVDATMRLFGWVKWSQRWQRWVRRFRSASIWIAKKNGKSPTLAWWGLYLLCADGEPGQHVYLCAKDGGQAREIAGKHALEMLAASPELSAECTVNKTLMQITHEPTRSTLAPISSADSRTQKAKEGLNGSVLIDETHVVDREFVGRVSRAGISRSEPLHVELSTAGDDPESYGKERWDYGELLARGGGNESHLHVSYHAPQDLTDEQLAADPLRYGRMANPAWGVTVDPDEYLADYLASRRSLAELSRFKMYRLNIWQRSATPWLKAEDWARCRDSYCEADLAGRECWAGLDLAKTRALTALVLVFPWEGGYRLLPYLFLPENTATEVADKVPYLEWARRNAIVLTPGSTCDYAFVRREFRRLCGLFRIRELAFDPWQAEQTTQEMSEGVLAGPTIEEGTGVPRIEFRQTLANYAGPTEEFERLVINGQMRHPGNPCLDWQAGHVEVICDANKNKRPVKPKQAELKSIDGMVAGIMGLARALLAPPPIEPFVEVW